MISQAASQAPSLPGPLTSGLSTSRMMRAVRTQSTRSDSMAQRPRAGSRLADSISSDTSSGVVDNPYGQRQPGERLEAWPDQHDFTMPDCAVCASVLLVW
jgi:hypothetical protein